ncbi:MAG TPA: oligosaccharide flippase family protein [candidate division Zixibacteria bacterium]|nr:oligosaccharide flippase family protein [candidate division Zixibacteria bacterium]
MRFLNSAIVTIACKAVAMICGLAVSIIIARELGPEGRGLYALVMTTIVMCVSFGVFGLTAANTFFIAKDAGKSRTIGIQSLVVGIIGTVLSIMAIGLIRHLSPTVLHGLDDSLLILTYTLIPLFLWGNLFAFAYLGRGRILAFNLFETGQRVIFFALALVLLWHLNKDLNAYLTTVLAVVGFLVVLYIINYFRNAAPGPLYEKGYTATAIGFGIRSYVASMLTLAVMRSGVLFVNYFGGNDDAGLFAVAQQFSELVIIVPTIIGTVLFGRVSRGDSNHITPVVMRIITWTFLPITLVMFLCSEWLILTIFGQEFARSILPLKIMLPGAYLLGLEVILAKDLAGRGYPWPAVLAWVPVLLINFAGFVIFIPKFGVNGAALSVTVSFLLIFILITAYYSKIGGVKIKDLFLLKLDDLRTLKTELSVSLFENFFSTGKGDQNAVSTVPAQNQAETQNVGG